MKRLISVAAATTLVLTACGGAGGGGSVAATVGDEEITVGDVEAVPNETTGAMTGDEFAQNLSLLIQVQVLRESAASEYGIEPTEEEISAELEEVLAEAGGLTVEEISQQQNWSEETVRDIAEVGLLQDAVIEKLGAELDEGEVQAGMEDENNVEVCARHLLVETEKEAKAAKDRIEGGEEFSAVATEVSTDPSAATNGGDLGCAPAGRYVPEFSQAALDAQIDAVTEPVETEFGFHVLQVYDRNPPTEEAIRQQLSTVAMRDWVTEQFAAAEVTVDEEYGTWTTDPQPQVLPPAG